MTSEIEGTEKKVLSSLMVRFLLAFSLGWLLQKVISKAHDMRIVMVAGNGEKTFSGRSKVREGEKTERELRIRVFFSFLRYIV